MSTAPGPVAQSERIDSIDVLRGFALLGILAMNIQLFAMPPAAYGNPTAYGDLTGANYAVWFSSHVFFDQKFMTIFSMLFGAGVVIFTTRMKERGRSPAALHYRRTLWLLLFGLAHAYLLWHGDILVLYALCALLVYPLRKLSPKVLLTVGLVVISFGGAIFFLMGLSMSSWPAEVRADLMTDWKPTAEEIQKQIAGFGGSWREQLPLRMEEAIGFQTYGIVLWGLWRAGGLMLVGMALYKWGVFSAQRPRETYVTMAAVGAGLGFPIIHAGVRMNEAANWDMVYSFFQGTTFNYFGSLLVSLAYVGLMMLFCQGTGGAWLKGSLRAVGQMAFTNYLMHTIICTTVFYGHGLGWFGHVSRLGQFGVVLGVWAAQLIYSPLWLARFRFGPFEWLWRSLTYWKPQPMRRA